MLAMEQKKTVAFLIRLPADQASLLRKVAKDLDISPTELIRSCTTLELARKTGDPEAFEAVSKMFREGVDEWLRSRIDYEIAKKKKEYEKKRA
jgi:hypothetical protein